MYCPQGFTLSPTGWSARSSVWGARPGGRGNLRNRNRNSASAGGRDAASTAARPLYSTHARPAEDQVLGMSSGPVMTAPCPQLGLGWEVMVAEGALFWLAEALSLVGRLMCWPMCWNGLRRSRSARGACVFPPCAPSFTVTRGGVVHTYAVFRVTCEDVDSQ